MMAEPLTDRMKEFAYLIELDTEVPSATGSEIEGLLSEALTVIATLEARVEALEGALKQLDVSISLALYAMERGEVVIAEEIFREHFEKPVRAALAPGEKA
jgi:hypothetical protein